VKPKLTVLSGGAVNSPALLLRSGLTAQGRVGERTWVHPVVVTLAEFEREIAPYAGAPQSVYSHHFIDRGPGRMGFFLEVPPMHPMLASVVSSGGGALWQDLLSHLPRTNALIALCPDGFLPEETGARVRLRKDGYGRHSIQYAFQPAHWEVFREATKEMAKIQFAAGAKRVVTMHSPEPVVMRSAADLAKLDAATWAPARVRVFTAHLMGGCAMGKAQEKSVVDPHLRFHDLDNLFVVDGSVFPTSLGVNPQETIFGIARWASRHIAQAV
jgi:choline dehydrogenase-like flavoprotein